MLGLNAIHRRDPDGGFAAYVAELRAANFQGETLDEARGIVAKRSKWSLTSIERAPTTRHEVRPR